MTPRPGKPVKPGKPLKPGKPIFKPPGFDPTSYPIWINPHHFMYARGFFDLTVTGPVTAFRPKSATEGVPYHLRLGLNLSSKVKLHGIAIFYECESSQCYISKVYLYEWNPETNRTTQLYNKDETLNSTDPAEYAFKIDDREIVGSITLELWITPKAVKNIHINAVKVMVKDV